MALVDIDTVVVGQEDFPVVIGGEAKGFLMEEEFTAVIMLGEVIGVWMEGEPTVGIIIGVADGRISDKRSWKGVQFHNMPRQSQLCEDNIS